MVGRSVLEPLALAAEGHGVEQQRDPARLPAAPVEVVRGGGHGRAAAPLARQRAQDRGRVEMARMVGHEDDRVRELVEDLTTRDPGAHVVVDHRAQPEAEQRLARRLRVAAARPGDVHLGVLARELAAALPSSVLFVRSPVPRLLSSSVSSGTRSRSSGRCSRSSGTRALMSVVRALPCWIARLTLPSLHAPSTPLVGEGFSLRLTANSEPTWISPVRPLSTRSPGGSLRNLQAGHDQQGGHHRQSGYQAKTHPRRDLSRRCPPASARPRGRAQQLRPRWPHRAPDRVTGRRRARRRRRRASITSPPYSSARRPHETGRCARKEQECVWPRRVPGAESRRVELDRSLSPSQRFRESGAGSPAPGRAEVFEMGLPGVQAAATASGPGARVQGPARSWPRARRRPGGHGACRWCGPASRSTEPSVDHRPGPQAIEEE